MTRAAQHSRRIAGFSAIAMAFTLTLNEVHAQNALGGGNRLDANLGVGTGRVNAPAPVEDFRTRNLIVTGNVAGGRGFRGTVGYGAEGDFRGVTGVDDLFQFRAGAAMSAPPLITTPGWQQLRFGRELGAMAFRRGDGAFTAGMATVPHQPGRHDEFRTQRPLDDRLRLDAVMATAGLAGRLDVPQPGRPVGFTLVDENRLVMFEASPLRGIMVTPGDDPRARLGLTPYDLARLRAEQPDAPQPRDLITQFDAGFTTLLDPGRIDHAASDARVRTATEDPMTGILERIARRFADRTDVLVHLDPRVIEQLDEEYRDLRERLARLSPAERWRIDAELAEQQRLALDLEEEWEARAGQIDPAPEPDVARAPDEPGPPRMGVGEVGPPGELDRLFDALRHGERIDRLATEGNTRFDELMAEAEESLRSGEYFNAERRFMRALRIMPGHPLAMIGVAHAQVGAGLQLPAAMTIRRIFSGHPELIDARYEGGILPSRPRLIEVVDAAELRVERTPGNEGEYGLVIAYIGRQIDDRTLIERGLSLMLEADPADPLAAVLRNVWLSEREQTPEK